jgi:hypothetical protein
MARVELPEDWQELLTGYVLNDLSPEETATFERLRAEHPEFASEILAYQQAFAQLAYAAPRRSLPNDFKATVMATATAITAVPPIAIEIAQPLPPSRPTLQGMAGAASAETVPPTTREPRQWSQTRRIVWGGGAIAALALVTLGIDNLRLRQQVQDVAKLRSQVQDQAIQIQQLQQRQTNLTTVLASLQQPNAKIRTLEAIPLDSDTAAKVPVDTANASMKLVLVPGQRQVVLAANQLPTLPDDQVYRLWALPEASNQPIYCGQFNPDDKGVSEWQAPQASCSSVPHRLLVSVDKATDPITGHGPLVMQSQV